MGELGGLPRINEIAAYVAKSAPQVAQSLDEGDPDVAEALECGIWGGDKVQVRTEQQIRRGLLAQGKVLSAALVDLLDVVGAELQENERTLSRLRKTRFSAAVLSAIASSSVLITALKSPISALIAGLLALSANLTSLTADQLFMGGKTTEASLRDTTASLTTCLAEGSLTQRHMREMNARDWSTDEMKNIVSQANGLFGKINEIRALRAGSR